MIRVAVSFDRPPGTTEQAYREGTRHALEAAARHWHETFVPLHFQLVANKRYGYQPRSGDGEPPQILNPGYAALRALGFNAPQYLQNWHYSWRKRKTKGHNRPNVWSGESEAIATNPANFVIRESNGRMRGVITGLPKYFYQFRKAGWATYTWTNARGEKQTSTVYFKKDQPNKAKELSTILNEEVEAMARVGDTRLQAFLNQHRPQPIAA